MCRNRSASTNRDVYRALADPTRRRILVLLRERDMTAGELAASFDLAWPTMSGHFAVLREAGLVQADRSGSTVTYHLDVGVLRKTVLALMDMFEIERGTACGPGTPPREPGTPPREPGPGAA